MRRTVVLLLVVLVFAAQLIALPVAAQELELPAAFVGHWEGTATQVNPTAEWPVTIELTGGPAGTVVGSVAYPSPQCGGNLTLARVDIDADLVELREAITSGEGVCADGGSVILTRRPDGSLQYQWSHPTVNSPATGTLTKGDLALSTDVTEARTTDLSAVTLSFAAGVSTEDESLILEGIRLAQDFYGVEFGAEVREPVTVTVTASDPNPKFVAEAGSHRITIQTSSPIWINEFMPLRRLENPVHEYFHLLQQELSGQTVGTPVLGPIWLVEGSAEYAAFQALAAKGIVSYDDVRAYHMVNVVFSPTPLPPLSDLESPDDFYGPRQGAAYSLGALATEILVADRGLPALRDFYARLGDGQEWETAFEEAFGQSPASFYEVFEAQRPGFAAVDASNLFIGSLQRPAPPVEGPFEVVINSAATSISSGEQALVTGWTVPGADCVLDVIDAAGQSAMTRTTTADTRGYAFWLWTAEPPFKPGIGAVEVSCGGTSVSATIEFV